MKQSLCLDYTLILLMVVCSIWFTGCGVQGKVLDVEFFDEYDSTPITPREKPAKFVRIDGDIHHAEFIGAIWIGGTYQSVIEVAGKIAAEFGADYYKIHMDEMTYIDTTSVTGYDYGAAGIAWVEKQGPPRRVRACEVHLYRIIE